MRWILGVFVVFWVLAALPGCCSQEPTAKMHEEQGFSLLQEGWHLELELAGYPRARVLHLNGFRGPASTSFGP